MALLIANKSVQPMPTKSPIPIIRSKLHRPPVANDVVERRRLLEAVNVSEENAVILVSAQAGYGKSTLISQWLSESDIKSAWLSLDPADSDVTNFLAYVVFAVQTVFPESCQETAGCLRMATVPSAQELAGVLSNDIDRIDSRFVLVLDDYHHLGSSQVHDLLDCLLRHPPQALQLVIITRRDPPLMLHGLRARGVLTEFRTQDLSFTESESTTFISNCLGEGVSREAVLRLHQATEGWPVGLRLATLAAPGPDAINSFAQQIPGDIHEVREYLLKEVLAQQPPAVRARLLRTSFLDKFDGRLCSIVAGGTDADMTETTECMTGERFLTHVRDAGLFGIALDNEQKWFRYHHLFQSMLQEQASVELGATEIHNIHMQASLWFEEQGYLEEAIRHLLEGDGSIAAGELIVRHRNQIMNFEQWHRLDRWLRLLTTGLIEQSAELLILQSRAQIVRGFKEEAWRTLDKVDELLVSQNLDSSEKRILKSSIESSRCLQHYTNSKGAEAVESARYALEYLPADCVAERGFAIIQLAISLQMIGQSDLAKRTIYDALANEMPAGEGGRSNRSRLFVALCFVHWVGADLQGLKTAAREIVERDEKSQLGVTKIFACFFQASALYHENRLADAESALENVAQLGDISNADFFSQCVYLTTLVYQEQGRREEALSMAKYALEYALKCQNKQLILCSEAFLAELAIRQGRVSEARAWARDFDPALLSPIYDFYSPQMTFAKLLVIDNSLASCDQARDTLDQLAIYMEGIHNKRYLVEVLALKAMLSDATGDRDTARRDLTTAISIALPGRFIRLFVDLGPQLAGLLNNLDLDEESLIYAGEILAAFRQSADTTGSGSEAPAIVSQRKQPGIDPLSKREQQILNLLAEWMNNKEIADKLHISVATVKRHAANIYEKLGVHDRQKAVAKAIGLGLIR